MPEGAVLAKEDRDRFRASLLSWLEVSKSNRMEFGTGITIKLDAIYSGEWDFHQVRDSIKRVMKKRSAPKLPKIALISHDAEDMRCLLNSSKSPFVGIMENGDGILRANFDCASTFYAASKAFTSGKVDLALELSKTTDVKVVSTTMAQAGRCQRAEISLDCTKAISKVHTVAKSYTGGVCSENYVSFPH